MINKSNIGELTVEQKDFRITIKQKEENINSLRQTCSRRKITRRSPEAGEKISSSPQRVAGVFRTAHFLGNEPFGKDRTLPRNLGASSPSGNVRGECRGWISFSWMRYRMEETQHSRKKQTKTPPAFLPRPFLRAKKEPRQDETNTQRKCFVLPSPYFYIRCWK